METSSTIASEAALRDSALTSPHSPSPHSNLEDTQAKQDNRGVRIAHAGISKLSWPIELFDGQNWQSVQAQWKLSAAVPAAQRGTHMSRFVQWVGEYAQRLDPNELPQLAEILRKRVEAPSCRIEISAQLYRTLESPESGLSAPAPMQCKFIATAKEGEAAQLLEGEFTQLIGTLCPCSKAISRYGAHNQRGELSVRWVAKNMPFHISEFGQLADECASIPLYPILKREDEKFVTEQAYDRPSFVEDVVREAVVRLRTFPLNWFAVEVENFESIHQHNAWALAEEGER